MLSDAIFTREFTRLAKRFGRRVDPDLADGYYDYLSHRLNDDQFIESMRYLFAEAERFPRPAEIILRAPPRRDANLLSPRILVHDPCQPVYIDIRSGSAEAHMWAKTKAERRDAAGQANLMPGEYLARNPKTKELESRHYYIIDSRGLPCFSRSMIDDEGRGWPLPIVRLS